MRAQILLKHARTPLSRARTPHTHAQTPFSRDSGKSKTDILKTPLTDFFADLGAEYVSLTYFFSKPRKAQK